MESSTSDPIIIYVGCAPNGEDAESLAVLLWSIQKHTRGPCHVHMLSLEKPALRDWNTSLWPTPFSGFRWAVPELNGFKGKAIYTDSDVIFMADARTLWDQPFPPGKAILAKSPGRLCVSLWDCAAVKDQMVPIEQLKSKGTNHTNMVSKISRSGLVAPFPNGNWNCLDGEDYETLTDPAIKAIHYTAMRHQPHLPLATARLHRFGRRHWFDGKWEHHWRKDLIRLFNDLLVEAEENGIAVDRFFDPNQPEIIYQKSSVAHVGPPKHRPR